MNPKIARLFGRQFRGGGGGDPGPSTSTNTTYTSSLPAYARPFFEQALTSAGKETFTTDDKGLVTGVKPYVPYTGERVAGFTPQQLAIQNEVANMQTPEDFARGSAGLNQTMNMGLNLTGAGLGNALNYRANPLQQLLVDMPGTFNSGVANYYMSPYQQAVTDSELRAATQRAQIERAGKSMGAIGRGTFGGARQALMQTQDDANTRILMDDIQKKGLQDAYLNAQQQYERDRTAGMSAEKMNLDSEINRRALEEQGRQFEATMGKDLGLAGMSAAMDSSKGLGALATAQQTADLERLKSQAASAAEVQAIQQKIDDINYQQFQEQQNWAKQQLEWYNAMLHGQQGLASTQINYTPQPSMLSQVGGLGLAGLGLYNVMNKPTGGT